MPFAFTNRRGFLTKALGGLGGLAGVLASAGPAEAGDSSRRKRFWRHYGLRHFSTTSRSRFRHHRHPFHHHHAPHYYHHPHYHPSPYHRVPRYYPPPVPHRRHYHYYPMPGPVFDDWPCSLGGPGPGGGFDPLALLEV